MKHYAFYMIVLIVASAWLVYKDYQYDKMVFEYEQELRVQHEYWKACDATRMYLEHVVEENGIETIWN